MMGEVLIIEPIDLNYGAVPPYIIVAEGTGFLNLVSDDPREFWRADDNTGYKIIDVDLGGTTQIDAVYLGNTNADSTSLWTIRLGNPVQGVPFTNVIVGAPMLLPSEDVRPARGCSIHVAEMTVPRFMRIEVSKPNGAPIEIGNVVIGKAFRPTYGREIGEGRTSLDSGFRGRLEDGSLSTVEGAFIPGFKWVFGDLSDAERKQLLGIVRRRKTTRPIIVVEDADQLTAESIRYATFVDLEQYNRLDPRKTRWAFTVEDWVGS